MGGKPVGEQLAQAEEIAAQSAGRGVWTPPQSNGAGGLRARDNGGATPCPVCSFASPSPGSPPAGSGCPHKSRGRKREGAPNSEMGAFEPVGPPGVGGDSPFAPTPLR